MTGGPSAETGRFAGLTHGRADWAGLRVVVAGLGVTGFAAADALLERGAQVVAVDGRDGRTQHERAIVLDTLGADVRLGPDAARGFPVPGGGPAELLILSPGWEDAPLRAQAEAAGVPVWGEAELAWRMRPEADPAPWLTVTGSRGKATTTTMLATMLLAAGRRAAATGQAGTSLLEAVLHPDPYDVLAVQLSAFQLRWSQSVRPLASACLNVAGTDLAPRRRAARGRVYRNTEVACVYNLADPVTEELVREADVIEGCRAIGFGLGVPGLSALGMVEDVLCDRAFVPERRTSAAELGELGDVQAAGAGVLAPHLIANALAAAALARAAGVPPVAVRDGLRAFRPLPHRLAPVAAAREVTWVDDAAATDPQATAAGLVAFERVVWVAADPPARAEPAGGYGELVAAHAGRLRGVVLLAGSGGVLRDALERHAPDVPVVQVDVAETGPVPVMEVVVARAGQLARPGDTVLFSPAADSPGGPLAERGAAFAAAARDRAAADGAG
jgi:UDP-N-acetylmuramoylalanine--D-glutamate ligase